MSLTAARPPASWPLLPLVYTTLACLLGMGFLPLAHPVRAHLALAMGSMPLIFAAMLYFSPTLTRTAPARGRQWFPPWLALLAGVMAVGGFTLTTMLLIPALLLALLATGWLFYDLHLRGKNCLGTPHGGLLWYQLALSCLFLALCAMGVALLVPDLYGALRLFHLHLNLLGFVGLTALGTLQVLLPTLSGRFDPNTPRRLKQDWPFALAAPLLVALGSAFWPPLALLGVVAGLLPPGRLLLALSRHQPTLWQKGGAAQSLIVALLAWIGLWLAATLLPQHSLLTGFFLLAFLLPLVSGALSHLLPLWWRPLPQQATWRQEAQGRLARWGGLRALVMVAAGVGILLQAPWGWPLGSLMIVFFVVQILLVARTQPQTGFTLVESLLAMLLLSLLAGYLVLTWPARDSPYLRAQQFASHVRLAQTRAMSQGVEWQVALQGDNGYRLHNRFGALGENHALGDVRWLSQAAPLIRFAHSGIPLAGFGSYVLGNEAGQQTVLLSEETGTIMVQP